MTELKLIIITYAVPLIARYTNSDQLLRKLYLLSQRYPNSVNFFLNDTSHTILSVGDFANDQK